MDSLGLWEKRLEHICPAGWKKDISLAECTTFRIGGPAKYGVYPQTAEQLCAAVELCRSSKMRYYVVGNGSNLLFSDRGFDGAVIFTGAMKQLSAESDRLTVDCGVLLTQAAVAAQRAQLGGMEFAYGIPGSVGGAVFMNAGAYDGEMKDIVESVLFYDAVSQETVLYQRQACGFDYRRSVFQEKEGVVLQTTLKLKKGEEAAIRLRMEEFMSRRRTKQPLKYPSAGSVFKRYPGFYTAKLIDDAGLKGLTVGGAQVSEKHAGFIVNRGGATAADVLTLIETIQEKIRVLYGIEIVCEIRYVE